jgi:hypothetical protein
MTDAVSVPQFEFIFAAHVTVDPALDLGDVGKGGRRIVPITGGDFSGCKSAARCCRAVRTGRSYATMARPSSRRATRCALTTAVDLCSQPCLRHGPPDVMAALAAGQPVDSRNYYFRGATFFETSDARYAWITKSIVVCTGEREPAGVKLKFYQML